MHCLSLEKIVRRNRSSKIRHQCENCKSHGDGARKAFGSLLSRIGLKNEIFLLYFYNIIFFDWQKREFFMWIPQNSKFHQVLNFIYETFSLTNVKMSRTHIYFNYINGINGIFYHYQIQVIYCNICIVYMVSNLWGVPRLFPKCYLQKNDNIENKYFFL